ncbi:hypothetical protein ABKN59_007099 [Abortiporus biennis]
MFALPCRYICREMIVWIIDPSSYVSFRALFENRTMKTIRSHANRMLYSGRFLLNVSLASSWKKALK